MIQREIPGTRQIQTILFSPKAAWASRGGAKDPLLQSNDTLFIFNFEDDRSELLSETIDRLKPKHSFKSDKNRRHLRQCALSRRLPAG